MPDWTAFARKVAVKIWKLNRRIDLITEIQSELRAAGFDLVSFEVIQNFDRVKRLVSRELEHRIERNRSQDITPRFRFSSIERDILIPSHDESTDIIRKRLQAAIRHLPWKSFEHFCVYVMKLQGVQKCQTMGTKEGGIDLVGTVDLGELTKSPLWYRAHLRVLGQVKIRKIGEPVVRLFAGDLARFARGEWKAFARAPQWFKTASGPIFGFMMTSRTFTGGARKFANAHHHIVLREGEQLVELLMRNRIAPGLMLDSSGNIRFSQHEFLEYFRNMTSAKS
jgi:restriction endonuclease Mrr